MPLTLRLGQRAPLSAAARRTRPGGKLTRADGGSISGLHRLQHRNHPRHTVFRAQCFPHLSVPVSRTGVPQRELTELLVIKTHEIQTVPGDPLEA